MSEQLSFVSGHGAGAGGIAFAKHADGLFLITCGGDGKVAVRDASSAAVLRAHAAGGPDSKAPLLCMDVSSNGDQVATGDQDNFVKVHKLPAGDFESNLARFDLPARSVAYNPSGTMVAAAAEDGTIKLINVADQRVSRTMMAEESIVSLKWDPEGEYLASVGVSGLVQVWDLSKGRTIWSSRRMAPKADHASGRHTVLSWQPNGALLAVPTPDGEVVCLERLSWTQVPDVLLTGEHKGPVNLAVFSPNGVYMVTAGADNVVAVWDVSSKAACKAPVQRRKVAKPVAAAAWHPTDNALALQDEAGEVAVWAEPVPKDLLGPTEDPESLPAGDDAAEDGGAVAADADKDGPQPGSSPPGSAADGATDAIEDGPAASGAEDAIEAGDESEGALDSFIERDDAPRLQRRPQPLLRDAAPLHQPQPPLQPGATPRAEGSRRHFLAYNMTGCISSRGDDGFRVVEVNFHDMRARKRVPHLNDFYNFTVAALGDKGAFYGSPSSAEAPSTLVWRPFDPWVSNSDWALGLPAGEEVAAVTAGRSFVAAATSTRALRLFSLAGLQTAVLTLEGAPVAMAASGHLLAVVWHAGAPSSHRDQALRYAVWDTAQQVECYRGPLPLSPGATLLWLAFTQPGLLAAMDSDGVVRVRSPEFGGCWVPVFSAAAARKGSEVFWPVSLDERQLFCVVCPGGSAEPWPQVVPRPVMSVMPLGVAVVAADAAAAPLEAEYLRSSMQLAQERLAMAEADSDDVAAAEDAIAARERDMDRTLLRLLQTALKADKPARALEIAGRLGNTGSLQGALKLAAHHGQRALEDRLAQLLDQRLELDAALAAEVAGAQEAVTPLRAVPASVEVQQRSPLGRDEGAGKDAEASPAAPPASTGSNPFSRRVVAPQEPPRFDVSGDEGHGVKRKSGGGGNPFARKSKVAKA